MKRFFVLFFILAQACAARVAQGPVMVERAKVPLPAISDALSERLRGLSALLAPQGFRRGETQLSGFLPNGDRCSERLALPARSCVAFVALASAGMIDLDAGLYTREGEVLIEDDNTDARPILTVCTGESAREIYYTLHAYQGGGAYLVQSFVRPQEASDRGLPFDATSTRGAWSALANRLKARGFDEQGVPVSLALAQKGELRVALAVEVGHCYAFVADVEGTLEDGALKVIELSGRELARGVHDGGPLSLQFCAERTQDLALIISGQVGGSLLLSRFVAREQNVGGARALWLGEPRR